MQPAKTQQRTCVGCRSTVEAAELVRLIVADQGEIVVDLAGGKFGRGAWVHATPSCILKAAPAGLSRSLRLEVKTNAAELTDAIAAAAVRRLHGLILTAKRIRKLEAGATAVELSVSDRRAELLIVATDARASQKFSWLEPLVASGTALAFGSKEIFGTWLGRPDTALLAVTEPKIAREAKQAIFLTMLDRPNVPRAGTRRAASWEAG